MKEMNLLFQRQSPVETPGYNDLFLAMSDGHLRAAGPCRTGPNYRQPEQYGGGSWMLSYGLLAPGHYIYECLNHRKFDKCLIINGGGRCPSVVPNPKHDGELWMSGVFVHCGISNDWPGSAGCQTLAPEWYTPFISLFSIGDKGKLELIDRVDYRPGH